MAGRDARPTLSLKVCANRSSTLDADETIDGTQPHPPSPIPHPGDPRLAELCRRFHVRRLDLFGSAATGEFAPDRSDLDLLVQFAPLEAADYADTYFEFREELEALFERPVDLVTASALSNPFFQRRVMAERRNLFPGH